MIIYDEDHQIELDRSLSLGFSFFASRSIYTSVEFSFEDFVTVCESGGNRIRRVLLKHAVRGVLST